MRGKILDRKACSMGPEHALLRLFWVPFAAPAGRRGVPAMLVHVAEALPALRKRYFLFEVKSILHFTGRVILRLEERVEVPECALHNLPVHLGKTHLQKDLAHLVYEPLGTGGIFPGKRFLAVF